jgi:hypothetical protein
MPPTARAGCRSSTLARDRQAMEIAAVIAALNAPRPQPTPVAAPQRPAGSPRPGSAGPARGSSPSTVPPARLGSGIEGFRRSAWDLAARSRSAAALWESGQQDEAKAAAQVTLQTLRILLPRSTAYGGYFQMQQASRQLAVALQGGPTTTRALRQAAMHFERAASYARER